MFSLPKLPIFLTVLCLLSAREQIFSQAMGLLSPEGNTASSSSAAAQVQLPATYLDLTLVDADLRSAIEGQYGVISRWDLQAPAKAQREYKKGYQLLGRKEFGAALQHMSAALVAYPNYVAAHNGLGAAYLALNQNGQAHAEFARAVQLDDHSPISLFNLGCSEMALRNYGAAEEEMQKAANLAPLDLYMRSALALGEYLNHDFTAAIETAHTVHRSKHQGAAVVHLFAAAAWQAEDKFEQAQQELKTLMEEDPKSPVMSQVQNMMARLKNEIRLSATKQKIPTLPPSRGLIEESRSSGSAPGTAAGVPSGRVDEGARVHQPEFESAPQVPGCSANAAWKQLSFSASGTALEVKNGDPLFRASADEVEVLFSALDHGKAIPNLNSGELSIRDDNRPPAAITSLRNEAQLPLRIGFVIDTSDSITFRIKFEQNVARDFLRHIATGPDDLSFVVGFSNTVLLAQDFTNDRNRISQVIGELAPSGGTALWDAVDFSARKLAEHPECQPVARILVVISDGEENSSSLSQQEAINRAQQEQVTVYTVSTREDIDRSFTSLAGEHTLRGLAELTGGATLDSSSLHSRSAGLQMQQVIRNRYIVTYKPGLFKRDGQYHPIEIAAEKDGRKLRIYARKGYFAVNTSEASNF